MEAGCAAKLRVGGAGRGGPKRDGGGEVAEDGPVEAGVMVPLAFRRAHTLVVGELGEWWGPKETRRGEKVREKPGKRLVKALLPGQGLSGFPFWKRG